MDIDRVSKILLCVLLLMLSLLVGKLFLTSRSAQAQARSYNHITYLGGFNANTGAVIILLDTRNGNVWSYGLTEGRVYYVGQLVELGQPLVRH
jgi:hypothetical protein